MMWRRQATPDWLAGNEEQLRHCAGTQLAVIHRVGRKRILLEIAGTKRNLKAIEARFGGTISFLPRNTFTASGQRRSIRIGRSLTIFNARPSQCSQKTLVIPAGAAFGTGEHATTAMSLRLLEQLSRKLSPGWRLLDLGTGSGILALAARKLGATKVIGIDIDPRAIATAKANAKANKITGADFRVAEVRDCCQRKRSDVVTANLFSAVLLEILPELHEARWLICSGVLRSQEEEVVRAALRSGFDIERIRRRGKWVALLCNGKQ